MKLNALALLLPLLVATSANAERVLVVMKDSTAFNKAHMAYKAKGKEFSGGLNLGVKSKAVGELEVALPHIASMIVDTEDVSQIEKLRNNPEVASVETEVFHKNLIPVNKSLMGDSLVSGELGAGTPWGIYAVKAPQAWKAGNSQGEGARVLVLDTGIDEKHASLNANFEKGKDFTYSQDGYDDKDAHGTHVAGTIAGVQDESGFAGVAPKAKILAGKVCSSDGCSNFAIASGINWGIQEKVDVISMSLGGSQSTPAERRAIDAADKAGITVVAASGNDGSGRVSYPAALPTVIAVGAIGDDMKKTDFSQYGPELAIVAPGKSVVSSVPTGTGRDAKTTVSNGKVEVVVKSNAFSGSKEVTTPVTGELVPAGLGKPADFAKANVAGKFALVSRGEISFAEKVSNAIKAKAKGIVVYNNEPGLILGSVVEEEGQTVAIPAFMIEQAVGQDIVAEISKGGTVSATLETAITDYSAFDGTSMATPHVSGVVALMKAANKDLTGAQVKEILKKTAVVLHDNTKLEVGAGLVDAEAAVQAALDAKRSNPQPPVDGQPGEQLEFDF